MPEDAITGDVLAELPPPDRFLGMTISAITRRRLVNFSRNRRGFWSLWIFLILFFTSLFAVAVPPTAPLWFDGVVIASVVAIAGGWYAIVALAMALAVRDVDGAVEAERQQDLRVDAVKALRAGLDDKSLDGHTRAVTDFAASRSLGTSVRSMPRARLASATPHFPKRLLRCGSGMDASTKAVPA